MNSSIFRTIPKSRTFKIPFKLKDDLLLDWLLELNTYSAHEACSLILQLLQALNDTDLAVKTRIAFLNIIHDYLKQYINKLEGSCWEANLPLSLKEQQYADAVVWNYLILAEAFFITAQDAGVKSEEMYAIYMTFFSLGQAQLHTAAIYATPVDGFWQLAYKVFTWCEKHKVLNIAINEAQLQDITPQTLFSQILVFYCCDTNQFRARDMRSVFNFLPKVCRNLNIYKLSELKFQTELLKIPCLQAVANNFGKLSAKLAEKVNEREDLIVFDIQKDIPPNSFSSLYSLSEPSLRYFSAESVVENLSMVIEKGDTWSGFLRSMNHELFNRVVRTLEPGKKRKHMRAQAGYTMLGVVGFENIISFLYKVNNKNNLKNKPLASAAPAASFAGDKPSPSSYEELQLYAASMQQMGAIDGGFETLEFISPSASTNGIWQDKNAADITTRPVSLKKLNIFDSSARGYSVFWTDDQYSKAKIGDLFAIISEDKKRLEIAIIRRISVAPGGNYKFGSEVLGFESEAVIVTYADNQSAGGWTIFIPAVKGTEQSDTLIYQVGYFQVGDCIYLYRQNKRIKAILAKEVNITASIVHAELDYL